LALVQRHSRTFADVHWAPQQDARIAGFPENVLLKHPDPVKGPAENGSESLPFEPPEQENIRLREENARLWRLLAVHSIPIPQLAPESPPPTKIAETAAPVRSHFKPMVTALLGRLR